MAGQARRLSALVALLAAGGAAADWVGNADFSTCPRQYFPDTHAQERFATREQCEARIVQVKQGFTAACARYWCSDASSNASSGAGGGAAQAGHQLDQHISEAISAGLQGKISAGDAAGLVGMGMLGNALLGSMAGDSLQEKARKAAARQALLEREAAAAAARRQQEDARAHSLLDAMLDDSSADAAPTDGLGSLMGDEAPTMDAGRTTGAASDSCDPATQPLGMLCDDPPVAAASSAPPPAALPAAPTNPPPPPPPLGFDAFAKGFEHATSCISQNGGPTCAVAGPGQFQGCVDDYRRGYGEGDKNRKLRIMNAYTNGGADRMLGRPSNGSSQPDAEGPCRIDIIQAYNSGYQGAPPPP